MITNIYDNLNRSSAVVQQIMLYVSGTLVTHKRQSVTI